MGWVSECERVSVPLLLNFKLCSLPPCTWYNPKNKTRCTRTSFKGHHYACLPHCSSFMHNHLSLLHRHSSLILFTPSIYPACGLSFNLTPLTLDATILFINWSSSIVCVKTTSTHSCPPFTASLVYRLIKRCFYLSYPLVVSTYSGFSSKFIRFL